MTCHGHERRDGDEFNAVHAQEQMPRATWKALFDRALKIINDLSGYADLMDLPFVADLERDISALAREAAELEGATHPTLRSADSD